MDISTLGAAKSYTDTAINGLSILVGKNCEISNIEVLPNGNKITFTWWDSNNVQQSNDITVLNGEQGIQGIQGVSTTNVEINEENHLIFTLSDSTIIDAGEIINGETNYENLNNKPKINDIELIGNKSISDLGIEIPTVTNDLTNVLKSNYDTAYTHSQSAHAPSNAEANIQSDWNETDNTSDAFIKNKPTIITDIPEYSVIKVQDDDYSSVYQLTKTTDEETINVGEAINIPKDMVVQSGEVKTCATANVPVSGYKVGDKYIDLIIANSNDQHIYILVSDLVDNNASGIKYDNTSSGLAATNVQTAIDELDNSKSDTNHTHNYAASDSAGGAATSAKKLDNTSAIGSATQPVYFNANGVPVTTSYTVDKSVPSNAVFTDTTYGVATASTNGLLSSTDKKKINIAEPQFAYCTADTSSTGYYKITINNASAWMMSFDVRIYHWYHCYNLCVSGYNYGENHWSSPKVITTSSTSPAKYTPVTFGYNSDGKLWFAVSAAPYTGILINDMNQGLNAPITDFSGLFTVEKVTELTGTTQTTINAYRPVYVNEGLVVTTVPTSATATGIKGDIAYDANYMYVCTDTNVWKRTALSSW